MALTRSALREKGITEKEILDYIMEEHGNTVESAKEKAKEAAEIAAQKTIESLQTTVDGLQAKVDSMPTETEDWKAKYDAEVEAHELTKTTTETEKAKAAKASKLEKLLVGDVYKVSSKYASKMAKDFNLDDLVDDGDSFKDFDKLFEAIKPDWSDMIGEARTEGSNLATPPKGQTHANYTIEQIKTMTPAQINANWYTGVKQAIEGGK